MKIDFTRIFKEKYPQAYQKLDASVSKLREKIDGYLFRERVLILIAFLIAIFSVWYFAMFLPVRRVARRYQVKINAVKAQHKIVTGQYRSVVKKLATTTGQQEQKLLQENIKKIDKRITQIARQVIPADEISDMLKDLLIKEGKLTFISMRSLATTTVVAPQVFGKDSRVSLLNQGVSFTFRGNFLNTLKYLKSLEASKWRLFWDSLTYDVDKYPEAMVTISVHTLVQHSSKKRSTQVKPLQTKEVK